MDLHNRIYKQRKKRTFVRGFKQQKNVFSTVYCPKCKDNIPVEENTDSKRVLAGHVSRCKSHKVHRKQSEVNNNDSEICFSVANDPFPDTCNEIYETNATKKEFIPCDDISWLSFQRQLFKRYLNNSNITINRQAHQPRAATVQDTIEFYNLATDLNLSNKEIDDTLKFINDMHV